MHAGTEKCADRLPRGVNNRFAVQIEQRIHHNEHTSEGIKFLVNRRYSGLNRAPSSRAVGCYQLSHLSRLLLRYQGD